MAARKGARLPAALLPIIADTVVRQDAAGRFNINDLHKAAGAKAKHQPGKWLELQQTKGLIEALVAEAQDQTKTGIPVLPVAVRHGGSGHGTFVAKELVYSYAMWIDPRFHLQVIRTFDAAVRGLDGWEKQRLRNKVYTKLLDEHVLQARQEQLKDAHAHHFANEHRLVNYAAFGRFESVDRDSLPASDLALLEALDRKDMTLLMRGVEYEQRKEALCTFAFAWRRSQARIT